MSEPSPTGYAMANEDMVWDGFDEFINSDAEFHWPAAGHDMQGIGTGEDGWDFFYWLTKGHSVSPIIGATKCGYRMGCLACLDVLASSNLINRIPAML